MERSQHFTVSLETFEAESLTRTSLGMESCLCYTIVSMLWYYSYAVRSYD